MTALSLTTFNWLSVFLNLKFNFKFWLTFCSIFMGLKDFGRFKGSVHRIHYISLYFSKSENQKSFQQWTHEICGIFKSGDGIENF